MIFKHKHLLEDLRKGGVKATAEILSVKTLGGGSGLKAVWAPDDDLSATWIDAWMKLLVTPEDRGEEPFEVAVTTRVHRVKFQGDHVPVWYDPSDHSKVVVDYEADLDRAVRAQAEMTHFQADSDRLRHRYEQRPGLAWTPIAGELLPVEAAAKRGTGGLTVSGPLAQVLLGPAQAAVSYVRDNAATLMPELDRGWFAGHDIRVFQPYGELPGGVTPEDGASAGLAVALALVSLLSGRIVRPEGAVLGGLTPAGEVLPAGGFKERVLAVKRSLTTRVIVPAASEPAVHEISEKQRKDLELVFVANAEEAVRAALAKHRVKGYSPPA
jgi:ATP-dependent Lon protease